MMDGASEQEVDRLWRAFQRDLGPALLEAAGFGDEVRALPRLERTWAELCEASPSTASSLFHAVSELHLMVCRSPAAEYHAIQMDELIDRVKVSRALNPDATASTVGEIVEMGESAVSQGLDDLDEYRRQATD